LPAAASLSLSRAATGGGRRALPAPFPPLKLPPPPPPQAPLLVRSFDGERGGAPELTSRYSCGRRLAICTRKLAVGAKSGLPQRLSSRSAWFMDRQRRAITDPSSLFPRSSTRSSCRWPTLDTILIRLFDRFSVSSLGAASSPLTRTSWLLLRSRLVKAGKAGAGRAGPGPPPRGTTSRTALWDRSSSRSEGSGASATTACSEWSRLRASRSDRSTL
jgi:hypothetical protein